MSLVPVSSNVAKEESPRLDDQVLSFLSASLSHEAVAIIADYMSQHFEGAIFGPWHWKTFWGATPVTLPSIETLRKRVTEAGKEPPKPVQEMSAEECANFVDEQGTEDHPEVPQYLQQCLSAPARAQGEPIGSTCAVTYIPQYVRRDGKVLAVTSRTLVYELGPKPVLGHAAYFHEADNAFRYTFSKDTADGTEPPCYYVMGLDVAPRTQGRSKRDLQDDMSYGFLGTWSTPAARNFIATLFSRRVWRRELPFGNTYIHILERSFDDAHMTLGCFGRYTGLSYKIIHPSIEERLVGAVYVNKFDPSARA